MLRLVQGHPKLMELADGLATDAGALEQHVTRAQEAWAAGGPPLEAFFRSGRSELNEADFLQALSDWTASVAGSLPDQSRGLFEFLCCLEEPDRTQSIILANWDDYLKRTAPSKPEASAREPTRPPLKPEAPGPRLPSRRSRRRSSGSDRPWPATAKEPSPAEMLQRLQGDWTTRRRPKLASNARASCSNCSTIRKPSRRSKPRRGPHYSRRWNRCWRRGWSNGGPWTRRTASEAKPSSRSIRAWPRPVSARRGPPSRRPSMRSWPRTGARGTSTASGP